jgi:hypothetical protein
LADGRVHRIDDGNRRPAGGSQFSSNTSQPNYLEENSSSAAEDISHIPQWNDQDEEDWPEFDRGRKPARRKRLLVFVLAGVIGLIVLVVWAIVAGSGSDRLVGSWKGTFQFRWRPDMPCTYRFFRDGTMVDEHPVLGMMGQSTGRYRFAHGEVNIHWTNGGFERATVRHIGPDTIEYMIQDHSDRTQIGGKITFVRERP